ncbi:MAG: phospholipase [Paramuribaculum sp.]|nr:phospholipase [Paramuribaculum sp.]
MKRKVIISAIILITALTVSGVKVVPMKGVIPDTYNFWLYEPDSVPADTVKPLVLFLHGASLCGRDLNRVKRYGTIDAIEKGRELDAFVIAPQNPGGAWRPEKLMRIIDWVTDSFAVDTTRIYVLGMSLGGYGTIDMAATYPEKIAAAMALCGGGSVKDFSGLNEVPLWIVHGTADRAVSVQQSDHVVSMMKKHDASTPRLIYQRVNGMNHGQPARIFYLPECYDWLLSHSLSDSARTVNPRTFDASSPASMRHAYKGLKSTRKHVGNKKTSTRKRTSKKTSKKK